MSVTADVLKVLHLILQFSFIGVTLLLLLVTAMNRMRVRRVLLSWRRGRYRSVPVWPTAFLSAVVLFFVGGLLMGQNLPVLMFTGYFVGGVFWFIARIIADGVLVTEFGLVNNANQAEEAVGWGQIIDYFETSASRQRRYVFFYLDKGDARCRLELMVPHSHAEAFGQIISDKLDARFDLSAQRVYGKKALKG